MPRVRRAIVRAITNAPSLPWKITAAMTEHSCVGGAPLRIPESWDAWKCECGKVHTLRRDPETCLRFIETGRYCWPDDGEPLCANCQQIISNRAGDLADVIDQDILDKVYGDLLRANGKPHP